MSGQESDAVTFYDGLAPLYNDLMEKSSATRKIVRDYFLNQVTGGTVLDFGGGTGLDLQWLVANGYSVKHCEISPQMRLRAAEWVRVNEKQNAIEVLRNDQADFRIWNDQTTPRANSILANFAVLNSISDTGLLFEKFSICLPENGDLIFSIVDTGLKALFRRYRFRILGMMTSTKLLTAQVHHGTHRHTIFLHRKSQLRKGYSSQFTLERYLSLPGELILIHLKKKVKFDS